MHRLKVVVATALGLSLLIINPVANAAEPAKPVSQPSASGIAMTPAIQDKVLGPADKTVSFSVELYNYSNQPVTMSMSTTDFGSLNQTGGVAFLGGNASSVTGDHGLSSVLTLDAPIVTIAPNSTKTVTAKVNNVEKLAVGGHYAAILARAIPPNLNQGGGNKVNINQVLSSLVFLQTAGKGTRTVALLRPEIDKVSFGLPDSVALAFKATGNTQTVPRGIVDVLRGDKAVQHGLINQSSSMVLPGGVRLLDTPLTGNQHPWWPGIYHLRVQYRYEGSLGISTYQTAFLYVNLIALLIMLTVASAAVYVLLRARKYWSTRVAAEPPVTKVIKQVIVVRDETPEPDKITVTLPVDEPGEEPAPEPVVAEPVSVPVKKAAEPKPYPNIVLKAPKVARTSKKATKKAPTKATKKPVKKAAAKSATKAPAKAAPKATKKTTKK